MAFKAERDRRRIRGAGNKKSEPMAPCEILVTVLLSKLRRAGERYDTLEKEIVENTAVYGVLWNTVTR